MPSSRDDVVIGAGILGLAHAYHLAGRGRRVLVLERDPRAQGASVRNFGMVWPIGQPEGPPRDLARRSAAIWRSVLEAARIWHDPSGSLHLAHHEDEARVLREFLEGSESGAPYRWLSSEEVRGLSPSVNRRGLIGALFSSEEVCVDSRDVLARLPDWLASELGIQFRFDTPVTAVEPGRVVASGDPIEAERIWICSGDETRVLFPKLLRASGIVRCKLQMMRSEPIGPPGSLGPMLAGGLTLRHYPAFQRCPGLPALCDRIAQESPWFDRHGIHVMVSQTRLGELTIGDSHEYGDPLGPFDNAEIDDHILEYLRGMLDIPGLRIASRWHGTYAKHPEQTHVVLEPGPGIRIVTGVGGAGMTFSFGLAEAQVNEVLGPR